LKEAERETVLNQCDHRLENVAGSSLRAPAYSRIGNEDTLMYATLPILALSGAPGSGQSGWEYVIRDGEKRALPQVLRLSWLG